MVIGNGFVWAHMPKTGGDATHALFALLPHLVEHADPRTHWSKHQPFSLRQREANIDLTSNRRRILNIRRLPSWMLSYTYHQHLHYGLDFDEDVLRAGRIVRQVFHLAGKPFYDRAMPKLQRFRFARRVLNKILTREIVHRRPDDILKRYEPEKVDFWLRQEQLTNDFIAVVRNFGEVSDDQEQALHALGYVNRNTYDRRWEHLFTAEDLERIYAMNPLWASIERTVYGSTLVG